MMAVAMLQQSMSIAATAKLGFNIRGEFRVQQQLNFNRSRAVVSWGYGRLQRFVESTPQKQQLRILLIADEGQQQQQATRRQTQQKKLRAESSIAEDVGSRSIDSELAHFVGEDVRQVEPERDFTGTPRIPIYVMLPLDTITPDNKVANPEELKRDLEALRSAEVDGVMVDCWWGLVEGKVPQQYDWSGYSHLFKIVRDAQLKLQVVMSFHQCGGNVGDDVNISLPQWVLDVGKENPDVFFTDQNGVRNPECLTWGVDKRRVLRGRTGVEVYYDYMRSFRQNLSDFFDDGTITEIEVGLGACGELRYPSYPENNGWKYPGIGEFQCYDKYLMESLKKAAEERGHPEWATGPSNAGGYNSKPQDTGFFRDGGDYDSYYGRFFLNWYSKVLIEHGDQVLRLANLAFEGVKIAAKVSTVALENTHLVVDICIPYDLLKLRCQESIGGIRQQAMQQSWQLVSITLPTVMDMQPLQTCWPRMRLHSTLPVLNFVPLIKQRVIQKQWQILRALSGRY
ncbi:hypothetical protein BDL97_10G008300 [Sphagnum fallax]|nr:hypothetical protein BDL97_10G008300 [Sphagnum fallax]